MVRKARSGSAPGPNGIPYKVYKKCPKVLRKVWQLFRVMWRKGTIPSCWKEAEGCFVPKEKDAKTIGQFRTIPLLNVEGKIFLSVLAKRISVYMVDNGYIDTSIQKAGIPGFSGCVEHTSVLTQLIKEAKEGRKNLSIIWLDLANAYGSVPHKLIDAAMELYHVPEKVQQIVKSYFGGIRIRFTVDEYTTAWQRLEKGIVTGCTISPILFVMGMSMLTRAAERKRDKRTADEFRDLPTPD